MSQVNVYFEKKPTNRLKSGVYQSIINANASKKLTDIFYSLAAFNESYVDKFNAQHIIKSI